MMRLSLINVIVIVLMLSLSGWALYQTACHLADGIGSFSEAGQNEFDFTLKQYLVLFLALGILVGALLNYYLVRTLLRPIRALIQSTKQLKDGAFPEPIQFNKKDEIGELIEQYNGLIQQLENNEVAREKTIADLSHEFRTPLANLQGYLKGLERSEIEPNEALFGALVNEAERIEQLVEQFEQLKQWNHLEQTTYIHKDDVEVQDLLEFCMQMFERRFKQKDICFELEAEAATVWMNRSGIEQVLSNLLDNALLYYEGSGCIRIRGILESEFYRFEVTGPSPEITDEHIPYIFDRLYRIEDEQGNQKSRGNGLGLAICREIIYKHQGEIYVESSKQESTFGFTIPLELKK